MQPTYNPGVFNVNDIAQAMAIIMTPEGSTTADRWDNETPYLADLVAEQFDITGCRKHVGRYCTKSRHRTGDHHHQPCCHH